MTHVWFSVHSMLGYPIMTHGHSVQQIWEDSARMVRQRDAQAKHSWGSYFESTCWVLRKHRNEVVFGGKRSRLEVLAQRAVQDAKLWMKYS